ncbi:MAG: hypothetical protein GY827_04605 [Cytophagales bacterium]|nr:hypothetical protein [Cytophagales bacterium]
MKKLVLAISILVVSLFTFTGCTDADVASQNLRKAADQFEIYRRVVFYNGITDNYILTVEGYCSITNNGRQLVVIVKTKDGKFLKHNLGLSDNVTYFSEQLKAAEVSDDQYRVIFKPKALVPTIELD